LLQALHGGGDEEGGDQQADRRQNMHGEQGGRLPVPGEEVSELADEVGDDHHGGRYPQNGSKEVVAETDPRRPRGVVEDDEGEPEQPQVEDHGKPFFHDLPVEPRQLRLQEAAGQPVEEVPPQEKRQRRPRHIRREVVEHPHELPEDDGAGDGERRNRGEQAPDGVQGDEQRGPQRPRRPHEMVQPLDEELPSLLTPEHLARGSAEEDVRRASGEQEERQDLEDVPRTAAQCPDLRPSGILQ